MEIAPVSMSVCRLIIASFKVLIAVSAAALRPVGLDGIPALVGVTKLATEGRKEGSKLLADLIPVSD